MFIFPAKNIATYSGLGETYEKVKITTKTVITVIAKKEITTLMNTGGDVSQSMLVWGIIPGKVLLYSFLSAANLLHVQSVCL